MTCVPSAWKTASKAEVNLGVAVSDQEARRQDGPVSGHRQLAAALDDPRRSGVVGHPGEVNPT
jgi:hypothetical protein